MAAAMEGWEQICAVALRGRGRGLVGSTWAWAQCVGEEKTRFCRRLFPALKLATARLAARRAAAAESLKQETSRAHLPRTSLLSCPHLKHQRRQVQQLTRQAHFMGALFLFGTATSPTVQAHVYLPVPVNQHRDGSRRVIRPAIKRRSALIHSYH